MGAGSQRILASQGGQFGVLYLFLYWFVAFLLFFNVPLDVSYTLGLPFYLLSVSSFVWF